MITPFLNGRPVACYWNDPDDGTCSGPCKVLEYKNFCEIAVVLKDGVDIEVYTSELSWPRDTAACGAHPPLPANNEAAIVDAIAEAIVDDMLG